MLGKRSLRVFTERVAEADAAELRVGDELVPTP
jgi:hypothetical protein